MIGMKMHFGLSVAAVAMFAVTNAPVAASGGVTATITDPVLQMQAYSVHIPAGWKFQGSVFPGPPCREQPYPVYRAYSADGLSEMRMLPRFDWTFSTLSSARASNQCLPLNRTLNASEFLRYYTGMIGAQQAGEMSVAPQVQQRTAAAVDQMRQMGANTPGAEVTGDIAAVRAFSKNGTFVIEQRLRAWVVCRSAPFLAGSRLTGCFARVDVLRAPKGKLDALAQMVDDDNLNTAAADRSWDAREAQLEMAVGNARLANQIAHNNAVMQAQQARFEQSMAIQQHNHEQFMAQMQASTDSSMRAANESMNARSTSASDWVDYALDQQTVTGSGGPAKVSSAYSHTWSNGAGQWYQTNDPNVNPNGVLGGNWSQQTVTHGNGAPR